MEDKIVVHGPTAVHGTLRVSGAKNSVLKLMAAALLAEGETTIGNVPEIHDVVIMAELLRRLGCGVAYDRAERTVRIDVPARLHHQADYDLVRAMRASISVLGPLVARCRTAEVALPGGDAIGARGLDMHRAGLEAMGAVLQIEHGYLVASVPETLRGTTFRLDYPSVGATENLMMAATLAEGTTVVDNAAREPEIVDIGRMLQGMGARIEGLGTSTVTVHGVAALHPVEHRTVPDRIVAGTWAFAAAVTGGTVEILGAEPDHLTVVLDKLRAAGCRVDTGDGRLVVAGPERPRAVNVSTLPYPGFPTDLQPFVVALNAVAEGSGMVTENVFEARWGFTAELERLGAGVRLDGHHALVTGVPLLSGAPVEAKDIRAGAALVIAGMAAEGETEVHGVGHVDRGYEHFVEQLAAAGAAVERRIAGGP
ncbi:UDP-N-acetylglucosamine 1-carboxyvinyltransferase [Kocuria sp. LUK]|uniref:UDP-N-acetylglucosamine 1-carboxyvinyltransferase n=1 Tax=Kocuria flava TaxID=446860 RepID=A0A2N4T2M3_9MICC|nr:MULTISPECIES: UDP-N-acetylglucosamine 1-carboxyvinyltransferase [Kocuria]MCD1145665.1 UDP-N-acetylglucosamine 1-carboxyvinyltransferase [Kocuria sp. LUK]PLC12489.1 UDP-N-acetylglucosamine 1-carboxyvinyltransferase [Kocuria flava]